MNTHYHAIVWIDHREAKIFHFNSSEADRLIVHPHRPTRHIHHDDNTPLDEGFFEHVVEALAGARSILITGPASAKSDLSTYITRRHPDVAPHVSGVETIDHPSDGALVAVARLYFKADDRWRPQL